MNSSDPRWHGGHKNAPQILGAKPRPVETMLGSLPVLLSSPFPTGLDREDLT